MPYIPMLSITDLPFRKYGTKNYRQVFDFILPHELVVEQWIVPRGTVVRLCTSPNFGICVLPTETKDVRGFVIPRRIFKW